jgi:hypothetical protein
MDVNLRNVMCVINECLFLSVELYTGNVTVQCVISRQKVFLTEHNCLRNTKLLNTFYIYIYIYIYGAFHNVLCDYKHL